MKTVAIKDTENDGSLKLLQNVYSHGNKISCSFTACLGTVTYIRLFPIQNASYNNEIFRGLKTSVVALSVNSVSKTATTERSSYLGAKSFRSRILEN